MDLKHTVFSHQRRRKPGPAFEVDFVNYSEGQAQVGPTPAFTRASSGTFVNENGRIVGKTKTTTTLVPNNLTANVSVITIDVPGGSVVGWLNGSTVVVMQDLNGDDIAGDAQNITGTILHKSDTTLTLRVTSRTTGAVAISDWWVSYRGLRLEHDPITLRRRGFLKEDNRTNFVTRSGEMHLWTGNGTRVVSTETCPDGTNSATLLTSGTASYAGFLRSLNNIPHTSGRIYTVSAFVKKGNWSYVSLDWGPLRPSGGMLPFFNLDTFVFNANGSSATGRIEHFPNGWMRLIVTGPAGSTNATGTVADFTLTGSNGASEGGVGADKTVYVWGYQVETDNSAVGSNVSSYIPTTILPALRSGDVYTHSSISSYYNAQGGTLVGQCSLNRRTDQVATELFRFGFEDGLSRVQLGVTNGGGQAIRAYIGIGPSGSFTFIGAGQCGGLGTLPPGPTLRKVAFTFASNDARVCLNGTLGTQDTSVELPSTTDLFRYNPQATIGRLWDGIITNIQYYRQRLPNSKLQTLTTTSTQDLTLGVDSITYLNDQIRITI
jgi:hypothetical protein